MQQVKNRSGERGMALAIILIAVCLGTFLLLGGIGGCYYVTTYNTLVIQDEGVNAAWADVENVYQRRADLIPNLVETVKGYATHEREALEAVVKARASATQTKVDAGALLNDPNAFQKFQAMQGKLSGALSRLMVVVEKYPDLKANQNFLKLQDELAGTENRIAVARMRFNEAARGYNTKRRGFIARMVATSNDFKERPYFEADKGAKTAPKVKFN